MADIKKDFRTKKPVNTAPSAQATNRPVGIPGFTGNLPIPPGTLLDSSTINLTPHEEKILRKGGWVPGQPIPTDLPKILAKKKEEIINDSTLPYDPKTPPLKMPTIQKMSDLSPEKQAELEKALTQAREQMANAQNDPVQKMLNENQGTIPGAHASVNYALAMAMAEQPETEQPKTEDKPKDEPKADTTSASSMTNCPHCGWELSRAEVAKPTLADKQSFLQAVLGQVRFKKTYSLFDGKLSFTFRELSTEESDMVYRQLAFDEVNNKITKVSDYVLHFIQYRLVCALESMTTPSTGPVELPEVMKYPFDDDLKETRLPELTKYVFETQLQTESLRRMAVQQFSKFSRLIEYMEAHSEDDDFFRMIEGQPS